MRIIGPNTMGVYGAKSNLHALMPPVMPLRGPISSFSQSGNLGTQILGWGVNEGLGFDKFVSSGNEGDLTCEDYLRYFAQDRDTRVIVAYLEGVDPDSNLLELARETSRKKPIIVLKGGRTRAGRSAAASHSGAMAGEVQIYRAVFRQSGMIEVPSSQGLLDCAKALAVYPVPRGDRVGILTRGGGWGVITTDTCEEYGLKVPPLPDNLIGEFSKILPKYWSRGNPVDMVATITREPYMQCLELLAQWDGVDAVIALQGSPRLTFEFSNRITGPEELIASMAMMAEAVSKMNDGPDHISEYMRQLVERTAKPIIAVDTGPTESHKATYVNYRVASFPTPERAVRVLKAMVAYGRFLEECT